MFYLSLPLLPSPPLPSPLPPPPLCVYQVFPVQEAEVVQQFLDTMEEEVTEVVAEEMSSQQLLAKLERLEVNISMHFSRNPNTLL